MNITAELIDLIKLAQGERTLTSFAEECNISAGNLSKILRNMNNSVPNAKTLKKISEHAANNVTIEELMIAAGYIPHVPYKVPINETPTFNDRLILEYEIEKFKRLLMANSKNISFLDGSDLCIEAVDAFLDALEMALGLAKLKNKKIQNKCL